MAKKEGNEVIKKTIVTTTTHTKVAPKKTSAKKVTPPKSTKKKTTTSKKATKKKRTSRKPSSRKTTVKKKSNIEKMLIENFTSLQGVMADLSVKFNSLAGSIAKLLEVFENAAKTLMEKDLNVGESRVDNAKVVERLDKLLEHDRVIARSLALLHEDHREEVQIQEQTRPARPQGIRPPQMPTGMRPQSTAPPVQRNPIQNTGGMEGYQRSISSGNPE
jgi:hypothetical protein